MFLVGAREEGLRSMEVAFGVLTVLLWMSDRRCSLCAVGPDQGLFPEPFASTNTPQFAV